MYLEGEPGACERSNAGYTIVIKLNTETLNLAGDNGGEGRGASIWHHLQGIRFSKKTDKRVK